MFAHTACALMDLKSFILAVNKIFLKSIGICNEHVAINV